jgi:hypothetical protein
MNPVAQAGGLRRIRTDNGSAFGCVRLRSAAVPRPGNLAALPRGPQQHRLRRLDLFPPALLPVGNPRTFGWPRAVEPFVSSTGAMPEHAASVAQENGSGAYLMPNGRGLRVASMVESSPAAATGVQWA